MIIREDWLGKRVRVSQANNPSLIGIAGECVEETKYTLRLATERGKKTVLKTHASFEVEGVRVQGSIITGRPHERTKRKVTKWQKTSKK